MSEPLVVPDPRVFALTAVHRDEDLDETTEWYEDAVTGEGRIPEDEPLDHLATFAVLATLGVRMPWHAK